MESLPHRHGITWEIGARLEAQDVTAKWYRAKIVDIDAQTSKVMVHFDGWNSRWDDWFPMDSERLRPCSKMADWRDKKKDKKSPFRVNQRVMARWKGLSMYPARIVTVNGNGTYRVMFSDGVQADVGSSQVKHASNDELSRAEKEIESRQWLQPQVAEGRRARKPTKNDESFIMLDPALRRRSGEKEEVKEEEPVKKKTKVENPASILRKLKKNRKYLKLGEALPDDTAGTGSKPGTSSGAMEESYDTFKASISTKRKRADSQPTSGRTTPTLSSACSATPSGPTTPSAQTTPIEEQSAEEQSDPCLSPRKLVKSNLHAKMARVREVCNKWKREKEKKLKTHSHTNVLSEDDKITLPETEDPISVPSRTVTTFTPLSVAIETGASISMDEQKSPIVSLTRLESDEKTSPPIKINPPSVPSTPLTPATPQTPLTPATPATPATPMTPITPATPITPITPLLDASFADSRNQYPCPHCSRGFRKENLLNYHLRYYHSDESSLPLESVVPPEELAVARKKADPVKREDRKRSRDSRDENPTEHRSSIFGHKRRSEEAKCGGNILIDTKRPSTGSYAGEELNPDLSSSSLNQDRLDLSSSDIKQERRDSSFNVEDLSFVSDSEASLKTERERYDSFGVDSIISEDLESVVGEERREEVINCLCGLVEENGLMIQCEVCLCWQHVICIRLSEDKLPVKYVCWVCSNPPGVRESMRHVHCQDWLKEGTWTRFGYLARTRDSIKRAPVLKAVAALLGDVHNVRNVLAGLRDTSKVVDNAGPEIESLHASLQVALAHGTIPPLGGQTDDDTNVVVGNNVGDLPSDNGTESLENHADSTSNIVGEPTYPTENSLTVNDNNGETTTSNINITDDSELKETSSDVTMNDVAATNNGGDNNLPEIKENETNGFVTDSDDVSGPAANDVTKSETATSTSVTSNMTSSNGGQHVLSDHSYLQSDDRHVVAFPNSTERDLNHDHASEQTNTSDTATVTLSEAQTNLNLYISAQQDALDEKMDFLEQQIGTLEDYDAGQPLPEDYDPLTDIAGVKKSLRGLIQDLFKVKRMATYSVSRR